ncbi:MAG: uroporphyrinogen decarboxylase family protein [Candidatus Bathyarchaeia archaeon]
MVEMTPFQRVVSAVTFQTPDRVPVVLYFQSGVQHVLSRFDYTWKECLEDERFLTRVIEQQYVYYKADNFFLPVDFRVEGEAMGSKVDYRLRCGHGFRMPVVIDYVCKTPADIDKLEVPDPKKDGRMPVILKTIEKLSKKYSNKVPVIGFANNPADIATDVLAPGYEGVFTLMATQPELAHKLINICAKTAAEFAKAMVEAGACAIATVVGGFNNLTIGVDQFNEYIIPSNKIIMNAIGKTPYIWHQCQDATPFFDSIANSGAAAVAFHEKVDLKWAKEKYGKKVALAGNVGVSTSDSVGMKGKPEDVDREAKKCIEIGKPGSGFALSAGCEVHHSIPEENILALIKAAEKYGRY